MRRIFCLLLVVSCLPAFGFENETPAQREARMAWRREARFGMFIHYGPVTLTGREISWSRANSTPGDTVVALEMDSNALKIPAVEVHPEATTPSI
jgi:hypothetical protein